jgi:hypothetical protein
MKELLISLRKKSKNKIFYFLISAIFLAGAGSAKAVCPLCVVVVAGGLGLSRWLGIDDTVSGTWIGGLVVSLIIWLFYELDKREINFRFQRTIIWLGFYLLTLLPLYFTGILGHPENKIFGVDKLLLGILLGSLFFLFGVFLHNFLKKKNQGKSFFPFQKVVIPLLFLMSLSFIFYLLTG